MARKPDPIKARQWTERLERFSKSDATVAAFCHSEGVSSASLYQWRRKLAPNADGDRRTRTRPGRQAKPAAFQPVQLVSSENASAVTIRLGDEVVVELARDTGLIEMVMNLLLARSRQGGDARPC